MSVNFESVSENLIVEYFSDSHNITNPFVKVPKLSKNKKGFIEYVIDLREKIEDLLLISDFNFLMRKNEINNMIKVDPNIQNILDKYAIKKEINLINIYDIYNIHCLHVFKIVKNICKELKLSSKNTKIVKKSALFHDFGKILIPYEILNKPSKLTFYEREIVNLHAQLSYELLKTIGFEKEVLEIIKNHHNLSVENSHLNFLTQIVSVADIYSALISERSYKKAYSNIEAFEILDKMCEDKKLSRNVVNALKSSLK